MAPPLISHRGGCHCGRVAFEVRAPADIVVSDCNCSICAPYAFLHLIVPAAQFTLLRGDGSLATYRFNTGVAKHHFCSHCGVKSFYIPRSDPDGVSVNVRCIDPATVTSMTVIPFDGREWESARERMGDGVA